MKLSVNVPDHIYKAILEGSGRGTLMNAFGVAEKDARFWASVVNEYGVPSDSLEEGEEVTDEKLAEENLKLYKTKIRFQDRLRIERKALRNFAKLEDYVYNSDLEILEHLKDEEKRIRTIKHVEKNNTVEGILHISDWHINSTILTNLNTFNFAKARERVAEFVYQAKKYFDAFKVTNVYVVITGDLINSDRRLDEKFAVEKSRIQAALYASDLIQQVILDLNTKYNISVVSVSGNESRLGMEHGFTDFVMSDNFDYLVHNILKRLFSNKEGVSFIDGSPGEVLFQVAGQNVLGLHGECFKKNFSGDIDRVIKKYAVYNKIVNFILFGHIHEPYISDIAARSGSLCGGDAYSNSKNYSSFASQNIHLLFDSGERHSVRIGLQFA